LQKGLSPNPSPKNSYICSRSRLQPANENNVAIIREQRVSITNAPCDAPVIPAEAGIQVFPLVPRLCLGTQTGRLRLTSRD
jgi:hypothetical protein